MVGGGSTHYRPYLRVQFLLLTFDFDFDFDPEPDPDPGPELDNFIVKTLEYLTTLVAKGKNIPRVKAPNTGPPTMPNIAKAASKTPGRYFTMKTIPYPMIPNTTARTLVPMVCFSSVRIILHPDAMKSLRHTAARELRPLLTVLRAPLNTPATKRPGTPGMSPITCITSLMGIMD